MIRFLTTILCFILLYYAAAAQSTQLEIGKRSLNAKISAGTPGKWSDAGGWKFFRTAPEAKWQRIGYLGKNLKPFIKADSSAYEDFLRYRRTKLGVTGCITGIIVSEFTASIAGVGWMISRIGESPAGTSPKSTATSRRLGALTLGFVAGGIGFGIYGKFLTRRSDRHLQKMVTDYNNSALSAVPDFKNNRNLCLRPILGSRIGFSLTF